MIPWEQKFEFSGKCRRHGDDPEVDKNGNVSLKESPEDLQRAYCEESISHQLPSSCGHWMQLIDTDDETESGAGAAASANTSPTKSTTGKSTRPPLPKQSAEDGEISSSTSSSRKSFKRMEEKGFPTSAFGEATQKRGGKRKRIYAATQHAIRVLSELKELRYNLWDSVPSSTLNI